MADWIESYRGMVCAWECDTVEHFTIAYYFEKLSDASRNLLDLIGEGEALGGTVNTGPSRLLTTFQHELRAGSTYHILSGVIGLDDETLTLGHQVVDSSTGRTGTWLAETLTLPQGTAGATRRRLEGHVVSWPGPKIVPPSALPKDAGALTARDRVKPWEAEAAGRITLSDIVHRFSGAGMHFLSTVGISAAFMHANRRGFSTFLLDIEIAAPARLGERLDTRTAAAHLGNTSFSYAHRMTGADGRLIASMLQAGVLLDLDARRPTPLPDEVRQAVAAELAKSR